MTPPGHIKPLPYVRGFGLTPSCTHSDSLNHTHTLEHTQHRKETCLIKEQFCEIRDAAGRMDVLEWMTAPRRKTDLVDPQLAHDDVVHCGGDLSPHIVVSAGVEDEVNGTWEAEGEKDVKVRRPLSFTRPFIVSITEQTRKSWPLWSYLMHPFSSRKPIPVSQIPT